MEIVQCEYCKKAQPNTQWYYYDAVGFEGAYCRECVNSDKHITVTRNRKGAMPTFYRIDHIEQDTPQRMSEMIKE